MEEAFAGRPIADTLHFGPSERRRAYENLNCASERKIDFVMLGCPHNSIEQVWLIASLLEGRQAQPGHCALGTHAARLARQSAERNGYVQHDRGGGRRGDERYLPRDLAARCRRARAPSRPIRPSRRIICRPSSACRLGSARSRDCVEAAITGRWNGGCNERRSPRPAQDRAARPQGRRRQRRGRGAGDAARRFRAGAASTSATARSSSAVMSCAARALRTRCWCFRAPKARRAGPPISTWRGSTAWRRRDDLQQDDHQSRARRGGHARAGDHRIRSGSADR